MPLVPAGRFLCVGPVTGSTIMLQNTPERSCVVTAFYKLEFVWGVLNWGVFLPDSWVVEIKKNLKCKIKSRLVSVCRKKRRSPLYGQWLGWRSSKFSFTQQHTPYLSQHSESGSGGSPCFPLSGREGEERANKEGGLVSVWLAVGAQGSLPPATQHADCMFNFGCFYSGELKIYSRSFSVTGKMKAPPCIYLHRSVSLNDSIFFLFIQVMWNGRQC